MKKYVWLSSILLLACMLGCLSATFPNLVESDQAQQKMFIPKSNAYNRSLLEHTLDTNLEYAIDDAISLGYSLSSNNSYMFNSVSNSELNTNDSYHIDLGIFNNLHIDISDDNSTNIHVDTFYSEHFPLNFENPDSWDYGYSLNEQKNTTYENIFSLNIIPSDLNISDYQQNNSALLEDWAQYSPIEAINFGYFYDLIDDSWFLNDFTCNVDYFSDLAGFYNASWNLHGNSTSGLDISIEMGLIQNNSLTDRLIFANASWEYYFNATVIQISTSEVVTQFWEFGNGTRTLLHQGNDLFPVPETTWTETYSETQYDHYDYPFEDVLFGFGLIALVIFALVLVGIIIVIIIIVWAVSRNRNPHSYQKSSEQFVEVPHSSQSSYIGRMDTPPPIKRTKPWESWNPNGYHGRMNTPPAIPPQKFCPNCGSVFTPQMIQLFRDKKAVFCQSCGEEVDLFFD
ncbi:hypothetical protein NEF87_001770 [Candidatus Lokiarchaeum ossiferum]|uniref:Zinc ribbon domain-containing protein n=1 Tax=Candidatus Lokiarchaeum ossiferum TaxID=2951803 RepID=A0ABY6HPZ6_9ARCH|nr:hypothetical protein NEF87_001770 [Candidatus Lokiarchaeum sp. B-35]